MKAILVDDESLALKNLTIKMKEVSRIKKTVTFLDPNQALDYLRKENVDVAFIEVEMESMSGLEMAKAIKELCPTCAIIFATEHSQYAVDAFRVRASGYLLKPIRIADIEAELDYIEHPIQPVFTEKRLRVQCFGDFAVFLDGVPIKFKRSKTKELFAYLIDRRGAEVTTAVLVSILWEDKPDTISQRAQLRNLVSDLTSTFSRLQVADVLIKNRGTLAVAVDRLDCDYYSYLRRDPWAVNSFIGEYMSTYSWAEMTLGSLYNQKEK